MAITELLEQWTAIHENHVGKPMPRQPISEDDLATLEATYKYPFPEELRDFLRFTNGIDIEQWIGENTMYSYFPSMWIPPMTVGQRVSTDGVCDLVGDVELSNGGVAEDGMPDLASVRRSADFMTNAGGDVVYVVLDGPTAGALWFWIGGEDPNWVARSLTELLESCILFEQHGLLNWDQFESNSGCAALVPPPAFRYGPFPGGLNGPPPPLFP